MDCCLQLFRPYSFILHILCIYKCRKPTELTRSRSQILSNGQPENVNTPEGGPPASPKYLSKCREPPCLIVGNLQRFVKLPEHLNRNEWLATHCYEFFHLINAYYGSIIAHCTIESCPIMRIRTSDGLQALIWPPDFITCAKEGHSSRSSMTTMFFSASNTLCREISATNYIDSALTWIETQLESPEKFPKAMKDAYPVNFEKRLVVPIFHLLFHVMAHIYEFHYENIVELEEEPHLNGLLAHFITFGREFKLLSMADLGPLGTLVDRLFPASVEMVPPVNLSVRRLSDEPGKIDTDASAKPIVEN